MLIDWFTVGAQVVNFAILVWLLKRFLYKPIIDAIDAREKRIALALADADAKTAEAQKERDEFLAKSEEFDRQRATLFIQATEEAHAERRRLFDEARQAAEELRVKRQEAIRNEASLLHEAISRRTREEVFAITRKTLADLATTNLEERLVEVFTRRLEEMDDKVKTDLVASLTKTSDPAIVRTAFELPPAQQAVLQNALNETFSTEIRIRFETAPNLISGIELATDGQKIAWSIADYLLSLERAIDELLQEEKQTEAKLEPSTQERTNP
ncbi:F0F1 ATP synthase subunit delta [Desulfogranum marinum]|uniref:F0F1 ATP synthase subunit delta n=1 Tax=Desulfogranum marinum TaxID=453220 RepID=UPI0019644F46|nr:F0F1 ATP synthase subunit delta [Desulfogranum marinum]MBM9511899.1 F0F1 ATP synthase subunit delta [Desulfogranum marinum]